MTKRSLRRLGARVVSIALVVLSGAACVFGRAFVHCDAPVYQEALVSGYLADPVLKPETFGFGDVRSPVSSLGTPTSSVFSRSTAPYSVAQVTRYCDPLPGGGGNSPPARSIRAVVRTVAIQRDWYPPSVFYGRIEPTLRRLGWVDDGYGEWSAEVFVSFCKKIISVASVLTVHAMGIRVTKDAQPAYPMEVDLSLTMSADPQRCPEPASPDETLTAAPRNPSDSPSGPP
jgi:hypothetical protein